MTHELRFANANIHQTSTEDHRCVLWDKDTYTFGVGLSYEEALRDLADNLDEEYGKNDFVDADRSD